LGPCEEDYENRIAFLQSNNIVIYHGAKPDVRPFIGNCHCTVHPSFYPEGMSNVLLESCAAGRPIITTGRPGCGEVVDDGINGYIVRQQDPDDLIKKIKHFLVLPYEEKKMMGIAARAKVEKEFDRQIVVNSYLKEIEKFVYV
jgi:galacturonosyltransferase